MNIASKKESQLILISNHLLASLATHPIQQLNLKQYQRTINKFCEQTKANKVYLFKVWIFKFTHLMNCKQVPMKTFFQSLLRLESYRVHPGSFSLFVQFLPLLCPCTNDSIQIEGRLNTVDHNVLTILPYCRFAFYFIVSVTTIRINLLSVSATRWQCGSQTCIATFIIMKNDKITNNSETPEAREKIKTDLESLE